MKFWVPAIVLACVVGASLAFLGAIPTGDVTRTPLEPAWQRADPVELQRLLRDSAASYRELWLIDEAAQRSRRVAALWVRSRAAGGRSSSTPIVTRGEAARRHVRGLGAWLNGLPADRLHATATGMRWVGEPGKSNAEVDVRVSLRLLQSLRRHRDITADAHVTLSPRGQGKALRWRIADVRVEPGGLQALTDPVLEVRANAMVLSEATHSLYAASAATEAQAALRQVRDRYTRVAGPRQTTLYVIDSRAQVKRLLGRSDTPQTEQPTGWTWEDGDVVLVWPELQKQPVAQRIGVVRHEVTHVVTLPLMRHAPTLVLEGIATMEEARALTADTGMVVDMRPLRAAFRAGTLKYDDLLHSTKANFGRSGSDAVELGYLASYATIGALEEQFTHEHLVRMLALLRTGVTIDVALQRVYRLKPVELKRLVRVWTADQVRKQGAA